MVLGEPGQDRQEDQVAGRAAGGKEHVDPLVGGLLSNDDDVFEETLTRAVAAGPAGERALLNAFDVSTDEYRISGIVSALGEATGGAAISSLRAMSLDHGGSEDVRTSALVALAKRQGVAASDVFARCFDDASDGVRGYALRALASAGDGRAWLAVLAVLEHELERPAPDLPFALQAATLSIQSEIVAAACYLGRFPQPPERATPVAHVLRRRWDRLYTAEQQWFTEHWPACNPANSLAADMPAPDWLATWISDPLFDVIYL